MQNTLFPKFALYRLRLLERQEIETFFRNCSRYGRKLRSETAPLQREEGHGAWGHCASRLSVRSLGEVI